MGSIVEKLKNAIDYIGGNGRDNTQIVAAENELSLQFSNEYKEYLSDIGLCVFDCHELTGISDEKRNNVVDVTNEQWSFNPLVPHNMYVIEETGMDYVVIWQDETGKIYISSYNEKPVKVADSIVEYYGF